jgi:squalene synthase HpnC
VADDSNARIETPSGKGAKDENFPVASRLLSSRYRPQIAAFYDFARAADDIADNPDLDPDEKIRRLDAFESALDGSSDIPKAATLARCLAESRVTDRHARDLLAAFRQDARKSRYATMSELQGYCALSASPVGRFLLDLHGEDAALYRNSDPLCDALQILNHLQDISDDFASLDRVYLPADLMAARGVTEKDLVSARATAGMRAVIDACLDECDRLIAAAAPLPVKLADRRLAANSAVILRLAARLSRRLRLQDPLAGRVALSRTDFLIAGVTGLVAGVAKL